MHSFGHSQEIIKDVGDAETVAARLGVQEFIGTHGLGHCRLVTESDVNVAKALALGADAVAMGTAELIALNCNAPLHEPDYEALGAAPGACYHCHTGRCPVGIATQEDELTSRLDPDEAGERVACFLRAVTMELTMIAKACGKSNVHNLEPEDLRALTLEASAMTGMPLAGIDKVANPW